MGVRGGQREGWCDRGAAKRSGPWGPGCVLWSGASNGPKNRVPFIMEWKINVEHLLCSMGGGGCCSKCQHHSLAFSCREREGTESW